MLTQGESETKGATASNSQRFKDSAGPWESEGLCAYGPLLRPGGQGRGSASGFKSAKYSQPGRGTASGAAPCRICRKSQISPNRPPLLAQADFDYPQDSEVESYIC